MWANDKLATDANVVAVFDNQDDADEAILALRLAGFRDNRIGYFSSTSTGGVLDQLERNYWIAGATLGTIAGAALGVWIARLISGWETPRGWGIDPLGLTMICAIFGSLILQLVGGVIGSGISRSLVNVPSRGPVVAPFVLAVSAGEAREQALAILRQHGGREAGPEDFPTVRTDHLPAGHAA